MELSARSQRKVNNIVEHASKLFVRNGFVKVTMESIAQYANVSKVTLYKYFTDKLTLYEYILAINAERDFQFTRDLITDLIPYEQKVRQLLEYDVSVFYDNTRPNKDESITLSLDSSKFIKKHQTRMKKLRQKLFLQGRMEEFICEEVNDDSLEVYYQAIYHGWIHVHPQLVKLSEEEQEHCINLMIQGLKKCP